MSKSAYKSMSVNKLLVNDIRFLRVQFIIKQY